MPRIPSAADVSPIGASASRLPSVRAEAADFGFAAASGLRAFGGGAAALGDRLSRDARKKAAEEPAPATEDAGTESKEKGLERAGAAASVVSHCVQLAEDSAQLVEAWKPDGSAPRAAAAKSGNELKAIEDNRLKDLPPEQQAMARAGTAPIHEAHRQRIGQRAHNRRVEAVLATTAETLQVLQGQAVREPPAAERYAGRGAALLQSLFDAGALTAEQLAAQNSAFRRALYSAAIQGQPAIDALADLEAGFYDEALADPALKDFLLTQARWRLQSETAQAKAGAGALVEGARRGQEQQALSTRTQRLLAAGDMADAELAAELARRTRENLERLRYAPEAVVREEIARLAPPADAADAEERRKLQEEARIQAEAMLQERRHDPAATVMGLPAVAEAFAAAEQDPALLDDAVAARLAAQAAMGLPTEQRRALTRQESAETMAGLDALPPAERVAALAELGRRYGDAGGAVAATLTEAGLSPVEALLLDAAADDPAAWRALTRLAGREGQGGQTRPPERDFIAETADRLIAEGRPLRDAVDPNGTEAPEDMRLDSEWFRPKRNPRREDESLEARLHIPKLTGTAREQVEALIERLGLQLSAPSDAIAGDILDVLKQVAVYRHTVRDGGLAARKRFRKQLDEVAKKGWNHDLDYSFAQQVWALANETIASPYMHPWSLNDIELTSAIGAMASTLKESADQSVGFELISTVAGLFAPVGKIGQVVDLTLSAIGLADSISTSVAQDNIWRLINEAIHRKILVVDLRAVTGAGLQP